MLDYIRIAWNYNFWAAARFLEAAEALSGEEFVRDLGAGVGSVRDKLAHICGADEVWMARIDGAAAKMPAHDEFADAGQLRQRQQAVHNRYRALLDTATPESLSVGVRYVNLKGAEFITPLDQILMHVANHGTYHRGQAASLLRRLTGAPPVTDLIEYFRGQPRP
jgi:uncharacterized damage-inducible protein DinB